jgi:hypothetical protein
MRLFRFLKYPVFQIDDKLWRCYSKLVLLLMCERKLIDKNSKIYINVDYTSKSDYFLILAASITIGTRAVPLYFSMRKYPKTAGNISLKKMEEAFIKGLRHILTKKYNYVIVADRGFGNQRFKTLCKEHGFNYVLRLKANINTEYKNKSKKLSAYKRIAELKDIYIKAWDSKERVIVRKKNKSLWWITSDISDASADDISAIYANRFKIEKCFQDQKSSGLCIEDSKIRKYDRFKRLLFCAAIAQLLTVFLGNIIHDDKHNIKKNFPLHLSLILAYSKLEDVQLKDYISIL